MIYTPERPMVGGMQLHLPTAFVIVTNQKCQLYRCWSVGDAVVWDEGIVVFLCEKLASFV